MREILFPGRPASRAMLAALTLAILAIALVAAGCTVRVVMPEVPATHPAHPDAAAAPLPEPSPLLDSYRPVEPPPEMAPMDPEGMEGMEGMDHGDMGHGQIDHDATGDEEEAPAPDEPAESEPHHHDPPPPPPARQAGAA